LRAEVKFKLDDFPEPKTDFSKREQAVLAVLDKRKK